MFDDVKKILEPIKYPLGTYNLEIKKRNKEFKGGEGLVDTNYKGSFSETTTASFSVEMALGLKDENDNPEDAVVAGYSFQIGLNTSFTGEDSLFDVALDAGNDVAAPVDTAEFDGNPDVDTLKVDGVSYTFPLGDRTTVLVGTGDDINELNTGACAYSSFTDMTVNCGTASVGTASVGSASGVTASYAFFMDDNRTPNIIMNNEDIEDAGLYINDKRENYYIDVKYNQNNQSVVDITDITGQKKIRYIGLNYIQFANVKLEFTKGTGMTSSEGKFDFNSAARIKINGTDYLMDEDGNIIELTSEQSISSSSVNVFNSFNVLGDTPNGDEFSSGYSGDSYGLALGYSGDSYGVTFAYSDGTMTLADENSYTALQGYYSTPLGSSLSVGYENVTGNEFDEESNEWFVGLQLGEVGQSADLAFNTMAGSQDNSDESYMYEAYYSYAVNDGMTVTPGIFIAENSTAGESDETGMVVKTSFSF